MRNIEPKMITFLDAKIASNGLAQKAIDDKDARMVFVLAMESCVGIREQGGNNKGPLVELMQETLGGADREPWCMSAVQTCLAYAEHKTGVVSPVFPSEHCLTVWHKTPESQRVTKEPARGAIAIWRHGDTTAGHTGMVLHYGSARGKMKTVEGNTESGILGGKIERDGGGVYVCERNTSTTGGMRIVGFLKPF